MESLSDNWAAVDGDDMVSVKTDEVCSAWVCCGNSNFGLVWILDDDLCMLSTLPISDYLCTAQA